MPGSRWKMHRWAGPCLLASDACAQCNAPRSKPSLPLCHHYLWALLLPAVAPQQLHLSPAIRRVHHPQAALPHRQAVGWACCAANSRWPPLKLLLLVLLPWCCRADGHAVVQDPRLPPQQHPRGLRGWRCAAEAQAGHCGGGPPNLQATAPGGQLEGGARIICICCSATQQLMTMLPCSIRAAGRAE